MRPLGKGCPALTAAIAAVVALAAALLAPASALADDPTFDRAFGAGPANLCATACQAGSNGGGAGQLSFPYATAVSGGEVYVADQNNHRVSVYTTAGAFVRAFGKGVNAGAGNPDLCTSATTCKAGAAGGAAGQLSSPYAVAVSGGEVYVADASNNRVSVFSTTGVFIRAFGKGVNPGAGSPDICTNVTSCRTGLSGSAAGQLSFPLGVAVSVGEVYVSDSSNSRVNVYGTDGTFARSFGTNGSAAGQLSFPFGLAVSGGAVYVADRNNQRISEFAADGTFVRAFGKSVNPSVGDPDICTALTTCRAGTSGGAAGQLRNPLGVAGAGGEVYVADGNHRVNVFASDGTFSRGFGNNVNLGAGTPDLCTTATGCQIGIAGGAAGQLNTPAGLAVSGTEVYIADTSNYRIGVFSTSGTFARAFGKNVWGAAPFVCTTATGCGPGAAGGGAAQLNLPQGVAVAGGEVYVADHTNHRVSVYGTNGVFARAFGRGVNAGAGNPDVCTSATGCRAGTSGSTAGQLSAPSAVAVSGGEVYVTDQNNQRISVFATDGTFSRAFGKAVNAGAGNPDVCTTATTCKTGTLGGAAGQLDNPAGIAVSGGEVYVTDQGNRRISVFATDGTFARAFGKAVNAGAGSPDVCTVVTTCRAGTTGATAGQLSTAYGLAVSGGEVYVADYANHRVSVFSTAGAFARAFGKAVNATTGTPDVCTTSCRAGSQGGLSGQLSFPYGVVVGTGAVYVTERFNARVSVLGTDGVFQRAFGKLVNAGAGNPDVCTTSCRAAAQGDAAAQFTEPVGIAINGTDIYAADRTIHRVSVYRVPNTEISSEPDSLAFGSRDIDDGPTATQSTTITNSGTETVSLAALTITGDTTHFARLTGAAGDCGGTTVMQPGESCIVRLRFDPATVGAKAATLTITSNAPAITVGLTGTGIQTELTPTPATLAFGSRDIDEGPTAIQTSTVTNTGNQTVTMSGLILSGDATQFERLTGAAGDCTASTVLSAGQTCALRYRFDPSAPGAKTATVTINSNAPATNLALSGTGTQTELSRNPATLAFGARDVDDGPAPTQSATILNTGSEPVTLTTLAMTGHTTQFERLAGSAGDCAPATVLPAGDACTVRLRFDPSTTGSKAATLTISSNAPAITVALTGSGSQTQLTQTPTTLAFGSRDVDTGATPSQSATIANTGTEAIAFTELALNGDSTQFELLTPAAGECTPTSVLQPGETCSVRVLFDPTSTGLKSSTLVVGSNAPPIGVALTGRGVQIELTHGPAALAFGSRDVNTGASPDQTATIANTGGEPITITGLTLSGDDTQFVRVTGGGGDCSTANRLEADEVCTLRVRFDPASTGAKAAVITVTSNAPPIAIALTGNGIKTELSSDPRALDFGWHDLDGAAADQATTIANTGTESVTLHDLALSGDTPHFSRLTGAAGDCTPTTRLQVGETCRLRLRFDPVMTGRKTATLTVGSNAPSITVDMTGTGTTMLPDYDGDGLPDDRDTDDDNDGVPDDLDAFPHDATRSAWPPPPPPPAPVEPAQAKPGKWRLKRVGRVRLVTKRGVVSVMTGYAAVCPKGGATCTGRLTLKLRRRSRMSRKVIPIFLTGRSRPVTVAAGARRRITLRLSERGRSLLRRSGTLLTVLRGSMRTGDQRAVVRRARLRLSASVRSSRRTPAPRRR